MRGSACSSPPSRSDVRSTCPVGGGGHGGGHGMGTSVGTAARTSARVSRSAPARSTSHVGGWPGRASSSATRRLHRSLCRCIAAADTRRPRDSCPCSATSRGASRSTSRSVRPLPHAARCTADRQHSLVHGSVSTTTGTADRSARRTRHRCQPCTHGRSSGYGSATPAARSRWVTCSESTPSTPGVRRADQRRSSVVLPLPGRPPTTTSTRSGGVSGVPVVCTGPPLVRSLPRCGADLSGSGGAAEGPLCDRATVGGPGPSGRTDP